MTQKWTRLHRLLQGNGSQNCPAWATIPKPNSPIKLASGDNFTFFFIGEKGAWNVCETGNAAIEKLEDDRKG
jgi:hypothetical protein